MATMSVTGITGRSRSGGRGRSARTVPSARATVTGRGDGCPVLRPLDRAPAPRAGGPAVAQAAPGDWRGHPFAAIQWSLAIAHAEYRQGDRARKLHENTRPHHRR